MKERIKKLLSDIGITEVPEAAVLVGEELCERIAERFISEGAVLPSYKIGDKVYSIVDGMDKIFEGEIYEIFISKTSVVFRIARKGYFTGAFSDGDIGKTVFLTKEEAEAALKESAELRGQEGDGDGAET